MDSKARAEFERDGYFLAPEAVPQDLVERAIEHMDSVIGGAYETGVPPLPYGTPDPSSNALIKIDQPQAADRTLLEVVSHPALGALAALITGAGMVQVWAVQLLYKPPGGEAVGNVGWHQDWQYWRNWWAEDSEVFTVWLALSDVTDQSGPMLLVKGSHKWGFLDAGNFFESDIEGLKDRMPVPPGQTWTAVPAVLPPGGVSFHHHLTVHGSGPNLSPEPRRSLAIHLRTDRSAPLPGGGYYIEHLDDPAVSPVIYRRS